MRRQLKYDYVNSLIMQINSCVIYVLLIVSVWCYELPSRMDSVTIENEVVSKSEVVDCEYRNVSFVNVTLRNVGFHRCNMSNISYISSKIVNLRLYEVRMSWLSINNSKFEIVSSVNSEISDVSISNSILLECVVVSEDSKPISISYMSIVNSSISEVNIINVIFANISLYDSKVINMGTTDVVSHNLSVYSSLNSSTFESSENTLSWSYVDSKLNNFNSYDEFRCFYCDLDIKFCPSVSPGTPFVTGVNNRECNMLHPIEVYSSTISRCGPGVYNTSLIDKCHRNINEYESFEYLSLPVADLILRKITVHSKNSSSIYKNIFCGICNNEKVEDLVFNPIYNVYNGWSSDEPPSYIYDIKNQMTNPTRFVKLMLLDISLFSMNEEIPFKHEITTCSRFVSTCTDFSNMDDVYRCYWYPAAYRLHAEVGEIYTIYRNKYCAKCNNKKEVGCTYPIVVLGLFRFEYISISSNLTQLLNSSNWLTIKSEPFYENTVVQYDSIAREFERESFDVFEIKRYFKV